jgi:hypothetical protein
MCSLVEKCYTALIGCQRIRRPINVRKMKLKVDLILVMKTVMKYNTYFMKKPNKIDYSPEDLLDDLVRSIKIKTFFFSFVSILVSNDRLSAV